MILNLDDDYRIQSDRYSWQVAKRKWSKKEEKWKWLPISWHASLEQAAKSVYDMWMRLSNAEDIVEARVEADRLLVKLSRALSPEFEVRRARD